MAFSPFLDSPMPGAVAFADIRRYSFPIPITFFATRVFSGKLAWRNMTIRFSARTSEGRRGADRLERPAGVRHVRLFEGVRERRGESRPAGGGGPEGQKTTPLDPRRQR